jgi:hypothetical protein
MKANQGIAQEHSGQRSYQSKPLPLERSRTKEGQRSNRGKIRPVGHQSNRAAARMIEVSVIRRMGSNFIGYRSAVNVLNRVGRTRQGQSGN